MVHEGDAQDVPGACDVAGDFPILARGCRVACGMVVGQDEAGGRQTHRSLENLLRVDNGEGVAAAGQHPVPQGAMAPIEVERMEFLVR